MVVHIIPFCSAYTPSYIYISVPVLSKPRTKVIHHTMLKRASVLRIVRQYSKLGEFTSGPPRLPKEQQEEFERLQKMARSQAAIDEYNTQLAETGTTPSTATDLKTDIGGFQQYKLVAEFEGDVNPKTGERGGPKQDPLKHGDWSFNGRVTDF